MFLKVNTCTVLAGDEIINVKEQLLNLHKIVQIAPNPKGLDVPGCYILMEGATMAHRSEDSYNDVYQQLANNIAE